MKSWSLKAAVMAIPLLLTACDTSKAPRSVPTETGGSGEAGATGAAGGATGAGGEGVLPIAVPGGLAILSSDYASTSVSLFDPGTNTLVRDDCIRSGITGGALTQRLSGDATLPTQADPVGHELVVIDRTNVTLSFVATPNCVVRKQISVGGAGSDGFGIAGFKANPHDFIRVDEHHAYVTRYEINSTPTPSAADLDEGNDLLVIDPATGQVQRRIDLTDQVTAGPGVLARPDRGVFAEGRVYVTLGNYDLTFKVAGAGRVVVIDPASDTVVGRIDLPDQKGCSGIEYAPATHKLYVACSSAGGDWPTRIATSAVVEIDIGGASLGTLGRVIPARALGAQPLTFVTAAVLDGTAYVTQLGSFPDDTQGIPALTDALYSVNLATNALQKLFDGGAYNLGRVAVIAETKRVYLPDGDSANPRVHVFVASSGVAVSAGVFEANPTGKLPPREIVRY
jgi:hypothetical protein